VAFSKFDFFLGKSETGVQVPVPPIPEFGGIQCYLLSSNFLKNKHIFLKITKNSGEESNHN
jgi:hypothetical protein